MILCLRIKLLPGAIISGLPFINCSFKSVSQTVHCVGFPTGWRIVMIAGSLLRGTACWPPLFLNLCQWCPSCSLFLQERRNCYIPSILFFSCLCPPASHQDCIGCKSPPARLPVHLPLSASTVIPTSHDNQNSRGVDDAARVSSEPWLAIASHPVTSNPYWTSVLLILRSCSSRASFCLQASRERHKKWWASCRCGPSLLAFENGHHACLTGFGYPIYVDCLT